MSIQIKNIKTENNSENSINIYKCLLVVLLKPEKDALASKILVTALFIYLFIRDNLLPVSLVLLPMTEAQGITLEGGRIPPNTTLTEYHQRHLQYNTNNYNFDTITPLTPSTTFTPPPLNKNHKISTKKPTRTQSYFLTLKTIED
ncbi:hypothetical protein Anas_02246 [Armadillidium nasatum]|uniref:Uncharacterized protein n=1 Tax=Armadillidium nasatum TaxID=96803 RepID=A0A5N5TGA3_9CRUS|nr:hypothetical protein Anas_02246 [Armadillidium nasatum]